MSKLVAAIVALAFALSAASGFAQDAAKGKKEELTKAQRAEMRERAKRLAAERAAKSNPPKKTAQDAKGAKATKPDAEKAIPKK